VRAGDPDREVVRRCLNGDQAAFEALYAAHAGAVKAYLLRSGFAQADADDLTQETFTRAFGSLATFDADRGAFRVWAAAIARNVARKYWARRREPEHFDPELAAESLAVSDNPGQAAEAREEVEAVRTCVDALPAELAHIVRLRYVEGRTTRGIAAAAGIPEATVRLRLREARETLAQRLRKKGFLK
jgi:RNA polymerase sigma-70 factor (ECF subfamily)